MDKVCVYNMIDETERTVLIAGAGHLGSRYLQSLASAPMPLEIHLLSPDQQSLRNCSDRWSHVGGDSTRHCIVSHYTIETLPEVVDLVVVSSTADVRVKLVEEIAATTDVGYWVIEKVLAQNPTDLERLKCATATAKKTWVNYYMLAEGLYSEVKARLSNQNPVHMEVAGCDWGLASNGLHFLHLFKWFNDSPIDSLSDNELATAWRKAKRPGNWEIFGGLGATCLNGAVLNMRVHEGPTSYRLFIKDGESEWEIFEEAGRALRSDGLQIVCPVHLQSKRHLVPEILLTGDCRLPKLQDVLTTDSLFLQLMLDCWRRCEDQNALRVPIT